MAPRAAALEDATDPADVATWLRKRGMSRRAEISRDVRRDLAACFSLLDEEDAGAIGAEALREAFRVLGLPRGSLERCRRLVDDASDERILGRARRADDDAPARRTRRARARRG